MSTEDIHARQTTDAENLQQIQPHPEDEIQQQPSSLPRTNARRIPLSIRQIKASETSDLRHKVLWPSVPLDEQLFPYDTVESTIHLGAFLSQDAESTRILEGIEDEYLPMGDQLQRRPIACLTIVIAEYAGSVDHLPLSVSSFLDNAKSKRTSKATEAFHSPEAQAQTQAQTQTQTQAQDQAQDQAEDQAPRQAQIRKFAVLPPLQGRGIGRTLFRQALSLLAKPTEDVLVHLDARATQVAFYTRLGMEVLDPDVFVKKGASGGVGVEYLRLGMVLHCRAGKGDEV